MLYVLRAVSVSPPSTVPDRAPRRLGPGGIAAMVVICAFWGGNTVAVKAAVPTLPAFGCAALRFLLSLPIIALACRRLGQPLRVARPLWWLLGVHALLTVAQIGTFNIGTSLGEAGRSSVFINVHPLIVAPLARAALGERFGGRGVLGLVSAAMGIVILLASSIRPGGPMAGDLIVLGSAVIFGVQTVAQKLTFPLIPPATLLLAQTVLAIPLFLAFSAAFEGFGAYHFTTEAVAGLAYQGVVVSGLCFTAWMVLLRVYPAGQLATVAFLTPLFGVASGNLIRSEPLTWSLAAGGGLVGLGIYLAASGGDSRPPGMKFPSREGLSAVTLGDDAL